MSDGTFHIQRPDPSVWADPPAEDVADLIAISRKHGWQEALNELGKNAPIFVRRMRNTHLGNWHILLGLDHKSSSLDVGTGFGSMVLGLSKWYRNAVGIEVLPDRVEYAAMRAAQDGRDGCLFTRGTGHLLPFKSASFDLVTLNGVLEWANLHENRGSPTVAQVDMLREANRVLRPGGRLAVAIENRFALETVLGMRDTHTQLEFVPALPRWLANLTSMMRRHEPYSTYLYSRQGYVRLFKEAGLPGGRVFDLVSSYNDYDFVLDTRDYLSYHYLYNHSLVRNFYKPAEKVRTFLGKVRPRWLGSLSYAYLVVSGLSGRTLLDAGHGIWSAVEHLGLTPGPARFAWNGDSEGTIAMAVHDGNNLLGLLEVGCDKLPAPNPIFDEHKRRLWGENTRTPVTATYKGSTILVHLPPR